MTTKQLELLKSSLIEYNVIVRIRICKVRRCHLHRSGKHFIFPPRHSVGPAREKGSLSCHAPIEKKSHAHEGRKACGRLCTAENNLRLLPGWQAKQPRHYFQLLAVYAAQSMEGLYRRNSHPLSVQLLAEILLSIQTS